jgi:hypothetical protein
VYQSASLPVANFAFIVCRGAGFSSYKITQVEKNCKFTISYFFLLDYRSHDCLILKLKENPSEKNRKLPVAIFIVYRLHKRLRKRWIRKHNQLQQSASLPVAFFVYHVCNLFPKLTEHPGVNINEFTGGQFFV